MIKLNKKGFTLIELLVVIAIIALLSTIAIVSLGGARVKARDAKRIADIKQMTTALELDYNTRGGYFPQAGEAAIAVPIGTSMTQVPAAPTPDDGGCTATQNTYRYNSTTVAGVASDCTTAPCESFEIGFCLGEATGGLVAGNACATPTGITSSAEGCNFAD